MYQFQKLSQKYYFYYFLISIFEFLFKLFYQFIINELNENLEQKKQAKGLLCNIAL